MGFPTEEGGREETSSLDMQGGGKWGRGGSGEGQNSPLMEKCRTLEKQSCHGKMCGHPFADRTEGAAGPTLSFFCVLLCPQPLIVLGNFGAKGDR